MPLPMRRHLAVVDDDGHGAMGDGAMGDGAMGDSIDDNCDSATNINNDGNGATYDTSTIMIASDKQRQ